MSCAVLPDQMNIIAVRFPGINTALVIHRLIPRVAQVAIQTGRSMEGALDRQQMVARPSVAAPAQIMDPLIARDLVTTVTTMAAVETLAVIQVM